MIVTLIFGLFLGFLIGYLHKKPVTYMTVHMSAEEAENLLECEEVVAKLKKEMNL